MRCSFGVIHAAARAAARNSVPPGAAPASAREASGGSERRHELQFRDLHETDTLPRGRDVLFIGHVDNGTHAVAVVPHDNPFRWLRPRDGTVRELGADVHVRTNEAPVKQAPRTAAPDSTKPAARAPSEYLV